MSLQQVWEILVVFGTASLQSFGGGNAVLPQIQLDAVHTYGWMTSQQFANAYALAQIAPGPSTLLVSAIGYQAAGLPGALLATVGMIVPAGVLMYVTVHYWFRSRGARWQQAVENGLASIAVGLLLSSAIVIVRSTEHNVLQLVITGVATVIFCATSVNPLWVMAACALLGWMLAI